MSMKLPVEFDQQAALLQVVTKVTRLTIVCAFVFVIETVSVERREKFERRDCAGADRCLYSG